MGITEGTHIGDSAKVVIEETKDVVEEVVDGTAEAAEEVVDGTAEAAEEVLEEVVPDEPVVETEDDSVNTTGTGTDSETEKVVIPQE